MEAEVPARVVSTRMRGHQPIGTAPFSSAAKCKSLKHTKVCWGRHGPNLSPASQIPGVNQPFGSSIDHE